MTKHRRLYLADQPVGTYSSTDSTLQTASSSTDSTLQTAHRTTCFLKGKVEMAKDSNGYGGDFGFQNDQPRNILFTDQFQEDLQYWQKKDPAKIKRIKTLINEIMSDPLSKGKGHAEILTYTKHEGYRVRSRRLDQEHRLLYKVTADTVCFLQARYHYNDQ